MAAAPVSPPDYFSLFGLVPRFGLDRADLEKRFYGLSRELHPDRFATESVERRIEATERMSLVNEAYRTLKDPEKLRDYFLRLMNLGSGPHVSGRPDQSKAQVPAELAESWFELQEALMEDPEQAQTLLQSFVTELAALKERGQKEILALETEIDRKLEASSQEASSDMPGLPGLKETFTKLADSVRAQSYLNSMERDVERIRAKYGN